MSPVVDNPMPLEIKQSPLTPNTVEHFKQVLRDRPDDRHRLATAVDETGTRLFHAIFNGRSVGLLLLRDTHVQPVVDTVVAHPATRGRGVGRALLEHAARALGSDPVVPDECRKS